MIWLNASSDDVEVRLPENAWVHKGEVVLSTCPDTPIGTAGHGRRRAAAAGPARCVVLREVRA